MDVIPAYGSPGSDENSGGGRSAPRKSRLEELRRRRDEKASAVRQRVLRMSQSAPVEFTSDGVNDLAGVKEKENVSHSTTSATVVTPTSSSDHSNVDLLNADSDAAKKLRAVEQKLSDMIVTEQECESQLAETRANLEKTNTENRKLQCEVECVREELLRAQQMLKDLESNSCEIHGAYPGSAGGGKRPQHNAAENEKMKAMLEEICQSWDETEESAGGGRGSKLEYERDQMTREALRLTEELESSRSEVEKLKAQLQELKQSQQSANGVKDVVSKLRKKQSQSSSYFM